MKIVTKLKISIDFDYLQMIEDNGLKTGEKDILSKIYDLSSKLIDVMRFYPKMASKRPNFYEIYLSIIDYLIRSN